MEGLNNLPPFYIGQAIVYITGKYMEKYSLHKVHQIVQEPCGCWIVGIGDERFSKKPIPPFFDYIHCCNCGKQYKSKGFCFTGWASTSFVPAQESVFPSLTMARVIEKEKHLVSLN